MFQIIPIGGICQRYNLYSSNFGKTAKIAKSKRMFKQTTSLRKRLQNCKSEESIIGVNTTAWKVSKYGVISGPYFPVLGPEITPYLDTFHTVYSTATHVAYIQQKVLHFTHKIK